MFYIIYFERVIRNHTSANDVTAKITTKNDVTSIVCLISGEDLSVTRHVFRATAIFNPSVRFQVDSKAHFPWHVTLKWEVVPSYERPIRSKSIAAILLEKVVTPLIVPAIKGFAAASAVLKPECLKVDKH
nr:hypothetical protein [Tanacetum cinerariifolium]